MILWMLCYVMWCHAMVCHVVFVYRHDSLESMVLFLHLLLCVMVCYAMVRCVLIESVCAYVDASCYVMLRYAMLGCVMWC